MEKIKMEVGIPDGMNIFTNSEGLKIERKWFSRQTLFLTVFAVFWNGFLFNWFSNVPDLGSLNQEDMMAVSFPLIHVSIGIGLIYYVIASYVNKTTIVVNHSLVEVRISPIPFGFKKLISSPSIEQVYCKEVTKQAKNGSSVSFEVRAILKDRKNICLVSGLESSEQALFLESEIESYLGIKDMSVKGELS